MNKGYKELIERVVKEEKKIVGEVAVKTARDLDGVVVDEEGNVIELTENGFEVFRTLYEKYKELGFGTAKIIIKKAIEPVLEKYPDIKIPEELMD